MPVRKEFNRAVSEYRAAVGMAQAARDLAPRIAPELPDRQRRLITQLAQAGTVITPGWLGQALERAIDEVPFGEAEGTQPLAVRIGQCSIGGDYSFPVIVNLLGTGHLFIDTAEDPRATGMVRAVLLRLLAARGADACRPLLVSAPGTGPLAAFSPLATAGLATVVDDVTTALDLVDAHVEQAAARNDPADIPELLFTATAVPESAVERVARLAARAVPARVHMIVAGWPGPAVTAATHVTVDDEVRVAGVALPVALDTAADEVVSSVCRRMAADGHWFDVAEE